MTTSKQNHHSRPPGRTRMPPRNAGITFGPGDQLNIDTVWLSATGIEWDTSDQPRSWLCSADGEIRFTRTNRLPVKGRFGTHSLQVRYEPIKKTLYIEGSLLGFLLGQNAFTSEELGKAVFRAIMYLKRKLGFSFSVSPQELVRDHVTLLRVDIAVNIQLKSGRMVQACLSQITRQLIEHHCMVTKAFSSVYWTPQASRYYSIGFYDKGQETRRKQLAAERSAGASKEKQAFLRRVADECRDVMRIELRLRSAELKKHGLQRVTSWKCEAPKQIFNHYFSNVPTLNAISSQMRRSDFDGIPDRLRPVIALQKLGAPMSLLYSQRTLARHCATLRKMKLDVKCPARPVVVPLEALLVSKHIKPTPTWLKDRRIPPTPHDAAPVRVANRKPTHKELI